MLLLSSRTSFIICSVLKIGPSIPISLRYRWFEIYLDSLAHANNNVKKVYYCQGVFAFIQPCWVGLWLDHYLSLFLGAKQVQKKYSIVQIILVYPKLSLTSRHKLYFYIFTLDFRLFYLLFGKQAQLELSRRTSANFSKRFQLPTIYKFSSNKIII